MLKSFMRLKSLGLTDSAIILYQILADLADERGIVQFTSRDYFDFTHCGPRTFSDRVAELSEALLISRQSLKRLRVHPIPEWTDRDELDVIDNGPLYRSVFFKQRYQTVSEQQTNLIDTIVKENKNFTVETIDEEGNDLTEHKIQSPNYRKSAGKPSKKTPMTKQPAQKKQPTADNIRISYNTDTKTKTEKRRFSRDLLNIETRQQQASMTQLMKSIRPLFAPDEKTVYTSLIEAFAICIKLDILDKTDLIKLTNRARAKRESGEVAYTWIYATGALQWILAEADYEMPVLHSDKQRKREDTSLIAENQRISEREEKLAELEEERRKATSNVAHEWLNRKRQPKSEPVLSSDK